MLGLAVNHETDGRVEIHPPGRALLGIADDRRASISSAEGRGLALARQVRDLDEMHALLNQNGIEVSPIRPAWGARACCPDDPEGGRIVIVALTPMLPE